MKLSIITTVSLSILFCFSVAKAQQQIENKFGKGIINVVANDSSYSMKMGARIQNLFIAQTELDQNMDLRDVEANMLLRRARIKFDGFAFSPKVKYKIEIGLSNRDISGADPTTKNAPRVILDAVVKWNFFKNMELWFGQTKLPGNRERVISSQKLQFVDRSLVNSKFNIDRDQGVQLRNKSSIGNFVIKEALSATQGEGRNVVTGNQGGLDYTARIDLLPLGEFASNGDYFGSDLKREEKPKLAIGVTYDFHDNAVREKGQLGSYMDSERDLTSIMADVMFKFKGISVMSEYVQKEADFPVLYDTLGNQTGAFYTGTGINFQLGYLLQSNWEVAVRYTAITPEAITGRDNINQYTLGVSRYIAGHNLKVQTDFSYTEEYPDDDPMLMWRFQVEVAF